MQPTLVILAAGMASRYGSMKQTQSFGPSGETIMDYSIYDAIEAGFQKVVFIIREDFASAFMGIFEPKLKGKIETEYVYQKLTSFTGDYQVPADRVKPWGTGQAVLCTKAAVGEPFAVINADDFYGKDAFKKAYDFLTTRVADDRYAVLGYELSNTLSDNGSVSRGVISTNDNGELTAIDERLKIYRKDGGIVYEDGDNFVPLTEDTKVSMNFFCFAPNFIALCERLFQEFLSKNINDPKAEFLMPKAADQFIKEGLGKLEVIPTSAKWFGVTYKEDAPVVKADIENLVKSGAYPDNLWGTVKNEI